ncbi:hypothetical protein [Pseudaquabacterium terrae]|nr:hypothetical protein [Aquabacterium terrae]
MTSMLAGLLLAAAGAAQATLVTTTVADVADMQAAQWAQQVLRDTGNAAVGFSAPAAGGNGGSFWLTDFARPAGPGNTSDVIANVFAGAAWNPATQGAVETIRFSFDARGLLSTGISSAVSGFVRPVIEQGGVIYSVLNTSTRIDLGSQWLTIDQLFSDESAWVDLGGTLAPDFSATGAPLHFGYRYDLGLTCNAGSCTAAHTQLGVDNFAVRVGTDVIAQVNEPAPWALLAMSLPLAVAAGRRGRSVQRRAASSAANAPSASGGENR